MNGRNAFVTLVMRDSSYAAGAAVLAHSIRNRCAECSYFSSHQRKENETQKGTTARQKLTFDLVCMHTNDVEEAIVHALSSVFDHVVPISYIQAPFVKKSHRLVSDRTFDFNLFFVRVHMLFVLLTPPFP